MWCNSERFPRYACLSTCAENVFLTFLFIVFLFSFFTSLPPFLPPAPQRPSRPSPSSMSLFLFFLARVRTGAGEWTPCTRNNASWWTWKTQFKLQFRFFFLAAFAVGPPPPPPPPIPLHWLPVFFFRARCSCEHGLTDSSLKNVNTRVPCMFCAPDLSLAFGLKSVRLVGSELWTRCFFPEARTWGAGFQITHMGCGFGEGGGGYRHADNRYWPSWKAPGARGPFCEQMVCVDHLGVVGERGGLPANRWYAFIIVGGVRGGGGGASGEPALRFARVFV